MADQAFVTLATNDSYSRGAMVLGKSLRNHNTSKKLVALIGQQVSEQCQSVLKRIYDEVRVVDVLESGDTAHLAMMKRPDLGVTFTKLHCWTLTHYSKCVFMDADTLVLSNIDDLFDREELSAAPDPGWPDCFNSGVFVFCPSMETHGKLLQYCSEHGSFDGGDQGVLNGFFNSWSTADISKHLPFIYNLSSIAIYTYLPAFKQYGGNAKVVHFLGQTKPWSYTFDPKAKKITGSVNEATTHPTFLVDWWTLYSSAVVPMLKEQYGDKPFQSGCVEHFALTLDDIPMFCLPIHLKKSQYCDLLPFESDQGEESSLAKELQPQLSSEERKEKWEQGQADYMGMDSFDNIQRKLDSFLK
ncbi:glycogenin-1b isoform X1 [Pleuronectes platessa]|uniref:glycogenin-1b isoform X1 n=1 Tax=Pleuronectes platessa TaxID=8262 RepID=UPI00232A703B|nr:glycogenin-1b isoform X1 [Pleuronectes platessa]